MSIPLMEGSIMKGSPLIAALAAGYLSHTWLSWTQALAVAILAFLVSEQ